MPNLNLPRVVSLCLLAALSGCGAGSSETLTNSPTAPLTPESSIPFDSGTVPTPPGTQGGLDGAVTLKRGCGWILAFDPVIEGPGNTAFADTGARYWVAFVAPDQPAGTTLKIEGRYANTRYAALHVHDGNLLVLDAQAEYQLRPDVGASTPWLDITTLQANVPRGGRYTATLRFGETAPAQRETNVLYRPATPATDGTAKRTTAIVYRTYLPVGENTGGVGLPRLTLQTANGPLTLDNAEDAAGCAEIGSRFYQDGAKIPGITNGLDPVPPLPKPVFKKFESLVLVLVALPLRLQHPAVRTGAGRHADHARTTGTPELCRGHRAHRLWRGGCGIAWHLSAQGHVLLAGGVRCQCGAGCGGGLCGLS